MPIYEYECHSCGKTLEVLQKFSDEPLTTCEACSGKLHKLISQSSFHLKGTGWYVTDYANKSKTDSASKTDKSEPAKAETTTGKKKPESTATDKTTPPSGAKDKN
jgi:putative FmdB family regulatory protein